MKEKMLSLPQCLGIEDEDRILEQCLISQIKEPDLAEILKKIMCSDYNSKEMLFAAYCVGKMQNSDPDEIKGLVAFLAMKKMKDIFEK